MKNNDTQSSALAEHSSQTGHRIDWDGVSVLGRQPNLRQRCLLESWFIHLYSGRSINRERGSLPYSYILLQRSSGGGAPRLTPAQSSLTAFCHCYCMMKIVVRTIETFGYITLLSGVYS